MSRKGVSPGEAAAVEALLAGAPLPATPRELVAYARREGASARELVLLRSLPQRRFASANDVGEALRPVQPAAQPAPRPRTRAESGEPPGPVHTAYEARPPVGLPAPAG